jgi:bisphosphoglycerate-independent phosphoglycerate mutase (AlkP superfamily)
MRSGKHHPDGALWIRTGTHRVVEEKVALERVAPTVLAQFGIEIPDYMKGEPLPVSLAG